MLRVAVLAATLLLLQAPTAPPPKPDTPTLTEVQRLQIQTLAQKLEIAQLKAQAAQRDFDSARDELSKLVVALKVEGYTLDLQTLSYTKDPPPQKK
jgi:hypothetical protein